MKQRRKGGPTEGRRSISFPYQVGQLGDVAGDASSLIKSQTIDNLSIARIGVAVDIGQNLSVRVYDLEAAV